MLRLFFYMLFLGCFFLLEACTTTPEKKQDFPPLEPHKDRRYKDVGKLFGDKGLTFGDQEEETGIGVNAYLWRSTLDVLSFFPLKTADPFGGVIMTEWYAPPSNPREQFKVNVVILSRQLRSDGIKVRVFSREKNKGTGSWQETAAHKNLQRHFEEVILLRARDLKAKEQPL